MKSIILTKFFITIPLTNPLRVSQTSTHLYLVSRRQQILKWIKLQDFFVKLFNVFLIVQWNTENFLFAIHYFAKVPIKFLNMLLLLCCFRDHPVYQEIQVLQDQSV